jgi:iron(III) transport system substrate-binding protein
MKLARTNTARLWSACGLPPLWICLVLLMGCSRSDRVVVVYTSQDQVYAEPILAEFTKQTGIKVLPVFDSESVKTAGLVQRLIAEKDRPVADIFWSNEEMLSRRLIDVGVLSSKQWSHAGYRSRVAIVNTNFVTHLESILDLTNSKWSGKIALAYPVYGTTAAHMVALRQKWGDQKWRAWCEALAANKPFVVDGNSMVVKLVGRGEAWIGLTDSDDLNAGRRNGLPIRGFRDLDFLSIPNTVGIVRDAPNKAEARILHDFLISTNSINQLQWAGALLAPGCFEIPNFFLTYPAPVDETLAELKTIFKRQ